jgi:catechol 2,3-dioxygenase-like lactoylglutathione lyase family enzyme
MLPTIPVVDLGRARTWYADKLGLEPLAQPADALLYGSDVEHGFLLFSSRTAGTSDHQVAAWLVDNVEAEVREMRRRGVEFLEYDRPELRTVGGVATTPVGKGAWFKDSEGNVLTLMQLDRTA